MSSSIFCRRGALGCSRAHFNPRTPCGVRRALPASGGLGGRFQSTHPLRGATPAPGRGARLAAISIHAPLAGCDRDTEQLLIVAVNISIHAPLAGCDDMQQAVTDTKLEISIHAPLAGCDNRKRIRLYGVFGISIHAPLAGCDDSSEERTARLGRISIHAPLAGCDGNRSCASTTTTHFNPRTPCGVRR